MFEASLQQGNLWKRIIDAIKDMVKEANFQCTSTGIQMQAMDEAHIALVGLHMHEAQFDQYRCDRSLNLGINIEHMAKMLKSAGNDDAVLLKASSTDALTFTFENKSSFKTSEFELKLMDIDNEALGVPKQRYRCVITMPSSDFSKIIKDLSSIGDTITIDATKDSVTFSADGDIGRGSTTLRNNEGEEEKATRVVLEEPVKFAFAVKYLVHFTKAAPLSSSVQLSLGQGSPLVVQYKIFDESDSGPKNDENDDDEEEDAQEKGGYLRFFLAPKIDGEDDANGDEDDDDDDDN